MRHGRPRGAAVIAAAALLALAPPATASAFAERLSERGPSTLLVGTAFTLSAPPLLLIGAATNRPVKVQGCRAAHGVKMIAAGAVLLPAGLLATPFNVRGAPLGWLDGLVDAFQEDYCTRPLNSFYP